MPTCSVSGCGDYPRSSGADLCEKHYGRKRRTGTTDLLPRKSKRGKPIPPARRERGTCVVEGCDLIDSGPHGMCAKHKTRVDRHGDPSVFVPYSERDMPKGASNPRWTGAQASYYAIHQRLKRARGRARAHRCTDCSGPASQWSYTRTNGPGHRECEIGPYSVDLADYDPRCVSCHKKFDLRESGGIDTTKLPHGEKKVGHKLTEVQVVEIRERCTRGESFPSVAGDFGLNPSTVSNIAYGVRWSRAGGPIINRRSISHG